MNKKIQIGKKILSANEEYARENRKVFTEHHLPCFNLISSPGSGKTSILAKTIGDLKGKLTAAVIEGDIATELDAQRIRSAGAAAIQINTDGACHLTAAQVNSALQKLPLNDLDLVFIENVGNLVCPSAFELGEDSKIVVLSVAEGDDKPLKYPGIFSKSKVMLINKIDLLEGPAKDDFDVEKVKADARKLNPNIEIFCVSAKTGKGMNEWYDWLLRVTAKTA
ncbi:MAG: hydrogenase nickel incorporation protein HypB [Phycisphaerae bacterium]